MADNRIEKYQKTRLMILNSLESMKVKTESGGKYDFLFAKQALESLTIYVNSVMPAVEWVKVSLDRLQDFFDMERKRFDTFKPAEGVTPRAPSQNEWADFLQELWDISIGDAMIHLEEGSYHGARQFRLTTSELLENLADQGIIISRQRLAQLRSGLTQTKGGKEYKIKPVLEEGVDWIKRDGKILFTEQALYIVADDRA